MQSEQRSGVLLKLFFLMQCIILTGCSTWLANSLDLGGIPVNLELEYSQPLLVSEAGDSAVIRVRLNQAPFDVVAITISVSDDSEIQAQPTKLNFDPGTWDQWQTITVTGVNDTERDGDIVLRLDFLPIISKDIKWHLFEPADISVTNRDNDRRAFITASSYTGSLGGISGADDKCMADSQKPSNTTYKAFLVEQTARIASLSPNAGDGQVDWVFQPNFEYYDSSMAIKIFKTNVNALFTDWPLSQAYPISLNYWTGMRTDWTLQDSCAYWWSASNTESTRTGNSSSLNFNLISSVALISCDNSYRLLCIEQ